MKLSAIYIARNEEKNIARSLESIKGQVDELILVDTGSTDKTKEIFQSYGGQVYDLPWQDDFSAPRNLALSKATGDWILLLDADEYFAPEVGGNVRRVLEKLPEKYQGLFVKLFNVDQTAVLDAFYGLRAVRRVPGLAYEGRIHEQLKLRGRNLQKLVQVPDRVLRLIHTGYGKVIAKAKAERNLKLMLADIQAGRPEEDLYPCLFEAYDGLGDEENAVKYAKLDVARGRQAVSYASRSYRGLMMRLAQPRNWAERLERLQLVRQAVEEFPELPEFQAEYSACLESFHRYREAAEAMEKAVSALQDYKGMEPSLMDKAVLPDLEKKLVELQGYAKRGQEPLVSIMIPTYNRPELFRLTLESALAQIYPYVEIIVNDNSTDDRTERLIQTYLQDGRLRYYRHPEVKSKAGNFAFFQQQAQGEYLQWCMDDDILLPHKLAKMVPVLRDNPDITLVTSQRGFMDGEGNILPSNYPDLVPNGKAYGVYEGQEIGRALLTSLSNFIGEPSATLFRRKDLQHHYWQADCRGYLAVSDVAMWLELLSKGNCVIFKEPLSYYRRHGQQEGQTPEVVLISRLEWLQLIEEHHHWGLFLAEDKEYFKGLQVLYQEYCGEWGCLPVLRRAKNWQFYAEAMQLVGEKLGKYLLSEGFQALKAEHWQLALDKLNLVLQTGDKYKIEALQLKARVCNAVMDYVGAAACVNEAWALLEQAEEKGTREFCQSLANDVGYYNKNIGEMGQAAVGYGASFEYADTLEQKAAAFGSYMYVILSRSDNRNQVQELLKQYRGIFKHVEPGNACFKRNTDKQDGKIHIGYLSPDFRQHVMFSFYYILLNGYSRDKFHVTCYSLTDKKDGYTDHLRDMVDEWRDVSGMVLDDVAEVVRCDGLDILVDLAGHSGGSGLAVLAQRLAPVQISGLGWMESTGLPTVDYLFTDRAADPEELLNMVEQPLYLNSQFCYTGRSDVPQCEGAPCKKNGYITFGVFNHYYKITPEVLLAWLQIMKHVPESRLLLKCQMYNSQSTVLMVQQRMEEMGFDMQRVIFEPATADYMERYLEVDIALDTYPYTGGGTTLDALYMGVPVISLYGQRRGSRFGLSILTAAGLTELAVDNMDDYMARAVALAGDYELLDEMHKSLRRILVQSPVMDGKRYMAELEQKYMELYRL